MSAVLGSNVNRAEPLGVAYVWIGAVAHEQGDQSTLIGKAPSHAEAKGGVSSALGALRTFIFQYCLDTKM